MRQVSRLLKPTWLNIIEKEYQFPSGGAAAEWIQRFLLMLEVRGSNPGHSASKKYHHLFPDTHMVAVTATPPLSCLLEYKPKKIVSESVTVSLLVNLEVRHSYFCVQILASQGCPAICPVNLKNLSAVTKPAHNGCQRTPMAPSN